jgi:transposase-like protein
MHSHKNARTTAHSRAQIARRVQGGVPITTVARAFGICDRTVKKWAERAVRTTLPLQDGS